MFNVRPGIAEVQLSVAGPDQTKRVQIKTSERGRVDQSRRPLHQDLLGCIVQRGPSRVVFCQTSPPLDFLHPRSKAPMVARACEGPFMPTETPIKTRSSGMPISKTNGVRDTIGQC